MDPLEFGAWSQPNWPWCESRVGPWRQRFCGSFASSRPFGDGGMEGVGQIKPLGWSFEVLAMIINQFFHITSTRVRLNW